MAETGLEFDTGSLVQFGQSEEVVLAEIERVSVPRAIGPIPNLLFGPYGSIRPLRQPRTRVHQFPRRPRVFAPPSGTPMGTSIQPDSSPPKVSANRPPSDSSRSPSLALRTRPTLRGRHCRDLRHHQPSDWRRHQWDDSRARSRGCRHDPLGRRQLTRVFTERRHTFRRRPRAPVTRCSPRCERMIQGSARIRARSIVCVRRRYAHRSGPPDEVPSRTDAVLAGSEPRSRRPGTLLAPSSTDEGNEPAAVRTPRYRQIADTVRTRILAGEFAAGRLLPSESGLKEYDVATVRRALEQLRRRRPARKPPGARLVCNRRPGPPATRRTRHPRTPIGHVGSDGGATGTRLLVRGLPRRQRRWRSAPAGCSRFGGSTLPTANRSLESRCGASRSARRSDDVEARPFYELLAETAGLHPRRCQPDHRGRCSFGRRRRAVGGAGWFAGTHL